MILQLDGGKLWLEEYEFFDICWDLFCDYMYVLNLLQISLITWKKVYSPIVYVESFTDFHKWYFNVSWSVMPNFLQPLRL